MRHTAIAFAAFVGLCPLVVSAQEFTGHVTDTSGALVPKAVIVIHNQGTNIDIKSRSTDAGIYFVPYLKPGTYTITAEMPGFSKEEKTDITLQVGQTAVIDLTLKPGAFNTTVIVNSSGELLDRGKGDIGEVVENTRVTELPLNGRDPSMLTILQAGVTWDNYLGYQRPFDDTQANTAINGGIPGNNELLLDGVSNESVQSGVNSIVAYIPPVDAVQEFKIVTNPYDAQYGRSGGGVEDIVLKSGTNKIHGDIYEFARRGWLDANDWQDNYYGTSRAAHKLDQYGFELDGPIVAPRIYNGHNKSFFVTQFENWNEITPSTIHTSVPEPAWKTGDFSSLVATDGTPATIYDPLTIHDDGTGTGNLIRDPFPGNIIPSNRLNPTAVAILNLMPAPNVAIPNGTYPYENNYVQPNPTINRYKNGLAKWDQAFGAKDRFTLRYGYWSRNQFENINGLPGILASGTYPQGERSNTFATEWTHTFTPNLLFDFRASAVVRADYENEGPTGYTTTDLGWPASLAAALGQGNSHFPQIYISEYASPGSSGSYQTVGNSLSLFPSATWNKGKHTIHAGIDLRLTQQVNQIEGTGPYFDVDRQWTQESYLDANYQANQGNPIASLLLGTFTSGYNNINPTAYWSQHYYAPFIQDDWKINKRLTVNLGMRWDINTAPTERHNAATYAFDTASVSPIDGLVNHSELPNGETIRGGVTFLGVNGNPRALYATGRGNIQPRVGFAYSLDNRMVLRGGFGEMFLNPKPGEYQYGFSSTTNYVGTLDNGITPIDNMSDPFQSIVQPVGAAGGLSTYVGNSISYVNPHYKLPSFWTYSLGFQLQLNKNSILQMGYAGTRTYNLDTQKDINPQSQADWTACNPEAGGSYAPCNALVANPFEGLAPFVGTSEYNAPTVLALNLHRPFPQYGDVTEHQVNGGESWYNALQTTIQQKIHDLTIHATWTWSKTMDAGGYTDTVYQIHQRYIDSDDRTHRVTLSGVYLLPVGRGKFLLRHTNRFVDTAIGGWELGSLFIYEVGEPWSVPSSLELIGDAHMPRKTFYGQGPSGSDYIQGVVPCVEGIDTNGNPSGIVTPSSVWNCTSADFKVRPTYAPTANVVYSGVRLPSYHQFDVNLSKNFAIYGRMKLQARLEGFNVLNHADWQDAYDTSWQDSGFAGGFGAIAKGYNDDQSNVARQVQVALKLMW